MIAQNARQIFPLHHLLFVALAVLLSLIYAMGLTGGWHFDDAPNLWALRYVDNYLTILYFTFAGEAGPTGRPLSLFSFALQAESYPGNPIDFLRINVALHVLNFLLVYVVLSQLCRFIWPELSRARWMALVASSIWAFSPLIMPATLMAVQRMTLLSATFLLIGLSVYLWGRMLHLKSPTKGLALMLVGIFGGTSLATLSKENGALLPALILCIEFFLLRPRGLHLPRKTGQVIYLLLGIPTLIIFLYLSAVGIFSLGYGNRDFTVADRLFTQASVLWDYVFALFAPATEHATPFTDDYAVSKASLTNVFQLLPTLGWFAALALMLWLRRWSFVPMFGLAWFMVAHSVESTTVPLEMYFGHRNYVPSIGLWFLVTWAAFIALPRADLRKWAITGAVLYLAINAIVLSSAAALWGNPRLASEMWHIQRDGSLRAAQYIANAHVREGDDRTADRIMARTLEHQPENVQIKLQRLSFCTGSHEDYVERYQAALHQIKSSPRVGLGGMAGLSHLITLSLSNHCEFLKTEELEVLLELSSPDTGHPRTTRLAARGKLLAMASLAIHQVRLDEASRFTLQAIEIDPSPFVLRSSVSRLLDSLPTNQAEEVIQALRSMEPDGYVARALWRREVESLEVGKSQ